MDFFSKLVECFAFVGLSNSSIQTIKEITHNKNYEERNILFEELKGSCIYIFFLLKNLIYFYKKKLYYKVIYYSYFLK